MRIALGGITHEANSFCPHVTDLADFEARQLLRDGEILRNWQSVRTEQAGALSVLTQLPDCEAIPTLLARAVVAENVHPSLKGGTPNQTSATFLGNRAAPGRQAALTGTRPAVISVWYRMRWHCPGASRGRSSGLT